MRRRGFRWTRLDGLFTRVAPARSPAHLLRAEQETVAFRGARRERLRRELIGWCLDGTGPRVGARVITAPGGQGKTRLAIALVRGIRHAKGWQAGFVDRDASEASVAALARHGGPVLLVVDYAESRAVQIEALVRACAAIPGPVRLLLLARADGDWRTELAERTQALHDLIADCPVTELEPVETTTEGRAAAWQEAVTDLAEGLHTLRVGRSVDWHRVARALTPPAKLHSGHYAPMLAIHMHALASLLDAAQPVGHAVTTEDILLAHEERHWYRAATRQRRARSLHLSPRMLRLAVAASTIFGAADRAEAIAIVRALPGFQDRGEDDHARLADWLARLHPATNGFWGPLRPALLGEHLAATVLMAGADVLDGPARAASPSQWVNALDTLARACVHYPLTPAICHLLALAPTSAGPAAILAAIRTQRPAPLVDALTMLADTADVDLMMALDGAAPPRTISLGELSVHVSSKLVTRLRPLATAQPDTMPALALSLNNLSARLGHVGENERAVATMEEAVTTYRALAKVRPDTFLPNLARSLNTLSGQLTGLGRREQGLAAIDEAVTTYRTLARTSPDAFRPGLAMSLNTLSASLAGLGRRDEALAAFDEVVSIRRLHVGARPAQRIKTTMDS